KSLAPGVGPLTSAINLSLTMLWRPAPDFAKEGRVLWVEWGRDDVAGSVEFAVLHLHWFRARRRVCQRLSDFRRTACGLRAVAGRRDAQALCRGTVRGDGEHHRGLLEPDVRHLFRDDAARGRSTGLTGFAVPRFS